MKNILKFIFFGAVVAAIIFGKKYIDKQTFNYKPTVEDAINYYFINNDSSKLEPLIKLLDDYSDEPDILFNIREHCDTTVWSWFEIVDGKYLCNRENLNSCKVQLEEFQSLMLKLNNLYSVKSKKENYTIITSAAYTNINQSVTSKTNQIQKVIKSPSSKNPPDNEEIRQNKCRKAVDCTNCRDGVCTCQFVTSKGTSETVRCNQDSNK